MPAGEVKKRFDAHKSMSSIADGLRKPERPTLASLKASTSIALGEEKSAANDNEDEAKNNGKFSKSSSSSSLTAKFDTDNATKVKAEKDSDSCSKSSKGSKYSKSCSSLKVKLNKDNVKKGKEKDTDNCSKSSSKSKTRPHSKGQTTLASLVPRRKKQLSRSKSSDGIEFPKRHRPKSNDDDNSEGKKPGLIRSKSSTGSKREKSTQGERPIARRGSSRSVPNNVASPIIAKPKILVAPNSPLRSIMNSNENDPPSTSSTNHQKQPAPKTEKTMDEMIHLAWFKPIQEKKKEKASSSNKKGEKSSKKKTSGLDQKLGKNKSRKRGNNDEDASVASSVIKPKTSKISVSEWDKIAADQDFTAKLPNRKMSWFGFFNAAPKDDSSCEGSGLDQSFSSIGDDDDDDDLDTSINVLDLQDADDKDADKSSDESSSSNESSDDSSSDESSTDINSSDSTDKNDKAKKKVDKDARAARKRASQLRKLQKKKKREQNKMKMHYRERGEPNSARRGGGRDRDAVRRGAGPGGRSLRDEQFDSHRQDGRGRDAMHHSVGPGIHKNARSGQDPFGFGDNQGPSNDVIGDFNSRQHGLGVSRHNRRLLRSRSQDDSTARYDGRGERKGARWGVQRTRSTDGGGFNNSRSNWDSGSKRGGRNVGAARFEDGGSRRGRRTAGEDPHGSDMDGSRRNPNKANGDPFDGPLNGSRHGRTAGVDPSNDFNSSQSGKFQIFPAVAATGGDPFHDFNNSFASLSGPSADPFGGADPFVDFNNSRSSFSSRDSRSDGRARGKNLQKDALIASLHESQDRLAFVHAGKWMTEKEQDANAVPKIQPWEKRKKEKALF